MSGTAAVVTQGTEPAVAAHPLPANEVARSRRPLLIIGGVALITALVGGGAYLYFNQSSAPSPEPVPAEAPAPEAEAVEAVEPVAPPPVEAEPEPTAEPAPPETAPEAPPVVAIPPSVEPKPAKAAPAPRPTPVTKPQAVEPQAAKPAPSTPTQAPPPAAQPAPAAPRITGLADAQNRECGSLSGFKRTICQEKVRVVFCTGKWGTTPDCPNYEQHDPFSTQ